MTDTDVVNHPPHYTAHPSGVECIQITEHMNFNLGNAVKYLWRAGLKHDALEDLAKAEFYVKREITRLQAQIAVDMAKAAMQVARGTAEEPITLPEDWRRTPSERLRELTHVDHAHDHQGICVKNRFARRCIKEL